MGMFKKTKRLVGNMLVSMKSPPAYLSWSQCGEDVILRSLFNDKKMKKISYLDIGASTPDSGDNTFLFYSGGSRGVCVEANKALIPKLQRIRPKDKILNVGVTIGDEQEADFFIFDCEGISTFDKKEAEKRAASGRYKIIETAKVPLISGNRLIKENFSTVPDLLSIDIEGLDLAVLQTLDFNTFPIPVICVETCTYSENHIRPKDASIAQYLVGKGYEIYADTYINTIFVHAKWFHVES
ncbi:MAG: FkbM family methyltransferase [Candidatus Omnitrophica bacterium]|nr:FkbM family methyltransferase [Candidatus Omnitrophota bacterium]